MRKSLFKILLFNFKETKNIIISITTTLVVCMIFLQIMHNPYLKIEAHNISDIFIIPTLILGIFIISSLIMTYSVGFYMKQNSKELGLIRMAGYDLKKTISYYSLKISVIYIIALILSIIISLLFITFIQALLYKLVAIKGEILFISLNAVNEAICVVMLILFVILFYQLMYINQTSISDLLKDNSIVIYKRNTRKYGLQLRNEFYIMMYFIGLILIIKSEFSGGVVIPSCLGAIGAYELFNKVFPSIFKKNIKINKTNKDQYILYGDLSLLMQQSKTTVLFILIVQIVMPILIIVMNSNTLAFYVYNLAYLLFNILLSVCLSKWLSTDYYNKKNHFKKLYALGFTKSHIQYIVRKYICLYYLILLGIISIYLFASTLAILKLSSYYLIYIIIIGLECYIPFLIALLVDERRIRREEF